MSTERNELDRIIVSKVNEGEVHDAADAILAAGYRRTRTITTLEELDGLPLGSVVIDAKGNVCEIDEWPVVNAHETFKGYIVAGEAEDWPLDRLALPATVLWEQP